VLLRVLLSDSSKVLLLFLLSLPRRFIVILVAIISLMYAKSRLVVFLLACIPTSIRIQSLFT